jgi:signal transduction histidine kinase
VLVSVTDTGAGMTPDQLTKLFRDGVQFNVNTLQAGKGSGLGLYIAKGIVEQHGGTLTADFKGLGCGTSFTMTRYTLCQTHHCCHPP